ncbi:HGxxPAAW family protein [Streptomyces sp. RP5T]|uniref:HGxxPAAW family protein n=1 Tax=Streptomyces sp. RP5T TaxID=2490848 RepID=UPI0021AD9195|nr:HGxxPAAW family protein [Streptomyces sp. RP5T]
MSAHQYDEGHTVAGWTGVAVATAGTSVLGLGVCTVSGALIAVGLVITAASALVTWALHLSGWGKPPGRRPREQWGMRVRDTGARQGHPGCVGCRMAGRRGARTGGRVGARAAATPPEPVSVGSRSAEPVSGAAVSTESVG